MVASSVASRATLWRNLSAAFSFLNLGNLNNYLTIKCLFHIFAKVNNFPGRHIPFHIFAKVNIPFDRNILTHILSSRMHILSKQKAPSFDRACFLSLVIFCMEISFPELSLFGVFLCPLIRFADPDSFLAHAVPTQQLSSLAELFD